MITINDKSKCCGCSACMSICPTVAITMFPDEQGFLYPVADTVKCIGCGKCEAVCPVLNPTPEREHEQLAYLLQHKDPAILRESTSGGAFTAIAQAVIRRGGVVFGAGYGGGFRVVHRYVEDTAELVAFRNSKYVQSDKAGSFGEVRGFLEAGRHVLFSGTPCEVEGLLDFLGDLGGSGLLLTADVVCRAVPSPLVLRTYLKMIDAGNITGLRFRDKRKYGYLYSQFVVECGNSCRVCEGIETNTYLRAFYSGVCLRPSCYTCAFRKRYRRSDFTLWDCWDASKFTGNHAKFTQSSGITRMLIHSEKGRELLPEILTQCTHEEIDPDVAVKYDAREMFEPVKKDGERCARFWRAFGDDPEGALREFFPKTLKTRLEAALRRAAFRTGIYSFVRGMYKRFFGERKR